eukprot:symbB.v1.2.027632.t3/scaffold2846.1/size68995/4
MADDPQYLRTTAGGRIFAVECITKIAGGPHLSHKSFPCGRWGHSAAQQCASDPSCAPSTETGSPVEPPMVSGAEWQSAKQSWGRKRSFSAVGTQWRLISEREEWRACVCILGCDILQDQCHGVPAVETCNVLRECYTRVDNEYATRLTSASSMFVDWPDKMSFTHVVWSVPMVNGCRASCASCTFCFGSNLHESAEVLGLLVAS